MIDYLGSARVGFRGIEWERDDLRGVSSDDGGLETEQFPAGFEAEGRGVGGDGVQDPGRAVRVADLGGGGHGGKPGGGESADVDVEGVDAGCEITELLDGVEHGGGGAGGKERVGDDVHGDEVGDALDERGLSTNQR